MRRPLTLLIAVSLGLISILAGWFLLLPSHPGSQRLELKREPNTPTGSMPQQVPKARQIVPSSSKALELPLFTPVGEESGITFEEDKKIPPSPPQMLRSILLANNTVKIEWGQGDNYVKYFTVYAEDAAGNLYQIGTVEKESGRVWFSFLDSKRLRDQDCLYTVTAVDVFGNESDRPTPAACTR